MGGTRHWRGAAEYAFMDGEEAKGLKERGDGNALKGKKPGESWREGKRKGPEPPRKGIHRIIKIGTEYRGNPSLCSGLELHHPIMSKLWDLGGQT